MMNYKEAKEKILRAIPIPENERVPIRESFGRVLAENLSLARDYPDCRLSAVDGYAFNDNQRGLFQNQGNVAAGRLPEFSLSPGECAAVMTGAAVPEGTDCVVRVEECQELSGNIKHLVPLKQGDLINEPSSEAKAGTPLARTGQVLAKSVYPSLFYAGIPAVSVFRPPRLGILTTGTELRDVGEEPQRGQVFNTNLYILDSFVRSLHLEVAVRQRIEDDEAAIREALESMSRTCDIIISSGGVSMGKYDYVKKILNQSNFNPLIQGTAIKPGRPLMVAEKNGKLFFGMPGYPAAFLTNALIYLVPALKKASGRTDYDYHFIQATLGTPMKSKKGKLYLNRAILKTGPNGWIASDPGSQKTSHFLNFSTVNGLAVLPEDVGKLEVGATVECLHFDLELT
jgi:molybdopterin molybdotransferase